MKLKLKAESAKFYPCGSVHHVAVELDMDKQQVVRLLDQIAVQLPARELVLMLDSVLECAGVER